MRPTRSAQRAVRQAKANRLYVMRPGRLDDLTALAAFTQPVPLRDPRRAQAQRRKERRSSTDRALDLGGDSRAIVLPRSPRHAGGVVGWGSVLGWDAGTSDVRAVAAIDPEYGQVDLWQSLLDWIESRARAVLLLTPPGEPLTLQVGVPERDETARVAFKAAGYRSTENRKGGTPRASADGSRRWDLPGGVSVPVVHLYVKPLCTGLR